ncbi:MAG: hypothetical protein JWM95_1172 [Gemmatimonadetes bacterium]|nr:hypothetical protein [Gemmatimonadota bacterium]
MLASLSRLDFPARTLTVRVRIADRRVLSLAAFSVAILTPVFFLSARALHGEHDVTVAFAHAAALVGAVLLGYEAFFAAQRTTWLRQPVVVRAPLDASIPFLPAWVWVYGALYYVIIAFPAGLLTDARTFAWFIAGGLAMLAVALPIYVVWPTETPAEWRSYEGGGVSRRFLRFIQSFDNGRGCVPSLHMAFSVYAATFYPWPLSVVLIPVVVGLACVLVKQHSILDLLPGWLLGLLAGVVIHARI